MVTPRPPKGSGSRAPLIALLIAAVVLLACAAGAVALLFYLRS